MLKYATQGLAVAVLILIMGILVLGSSAKELAGEMEALSPSLGDAGSRVVLVDGPTSPARRAKSDVQPSSAVAFSMFAPMLTATSTAITDVDSVTVPEGDTATFQVKLSDQPASPITASVSRVSGDMDITVQSGMTLTFTTLDWDSYQTVTLAAAEDDDMASGVATVQISATGLVDKDVTARELDNEPCGPIEVPSCIIDTSTTWYQACSPYIVKGNILVQQGVTLTVESGVEVKFDGDYFLEVEGTLTAVGTTSQRIVFTSNQDPPTREDWQGIKFQEGSTGTIRYADIHYAQTGVYIYKAFPEVSYITVTHANVGISSSRGTTTFANNTITTTTECCWSGISIDDADSTTVDVSSNTISGPANGVRIQNCDGSTITVSNNVMTQLQRHIGTNTGGVFVSESNSTLSITNNTVSEAMNTYYGASGVYVTGDFVSLTVSGNTLTDNQGGLTISTADNPVTVSNNTISNNSGNGIYLNLYSGATNVSITNNTLTDNGTGISWSGNSNTPSPQINYNDITGSTGYALNVNTQRGTYTTLDARYNWWGTTNAATIASKTFDEEDDYRYFTANYSPLLGSSHVNPILGPDDPSVSITSQSGTTANPIFALALSADASATEMLISDDHTFPVQFQWEAFASSKDFHTSGTEYIYAKFKDASGNESAIAFAKPPRIMYIQKSSTLGGCPVLAQVRVASDLGGGQGGGGFPLNTSQARVAADSRQVKTFYRPIGGSDYTELTMTLANDIYSAWIPGSQTLNGIEYYFQVEDANGNVLATLPETNPSTQPYSLSATTLLQEDVTAGQDNAAEFAVGLTAQIPAGALASDTQLQIAPPAATPDPPPGITATDINYALSMADGTTTFSQPMTLTFGYADSDVAGMDATDLRAYYLDNGTVKLAGGTVNTTAHTVAFETTHFTDFFLAEGSAMYPDPITTGTEGVPIAIQTSVITYVPVQSATLYYQVGTDGDWQSLAMSQDGDYYQATIPGGDVTEAGLAYYIQASDGTTSTTFPATDPVNNPQVINVTLLLPLQTGWNLISIPRDQANTAITTVLSSISGSYDLVYAYDASDPSDPWKKYNVNAPAYSNDLTNIIDETMGVWVHTTAEDTLIVAGSIPTTTNIQLYQGWNLVGYPGIQAKAISEALSSIGGQYTLVCAYDAYDPADPWKKYNDNAPPYANNLSDMRSRWGFWIQVTENCTLTINN